MPEEVTARTDAPPDARPAAPSDAPSDAPSEHLQKVYEASELPRERLLRVGVENLKNAEVLAILLRTGSRGENVLHLAERILQESGGLAGLGRMRFDQLTELRGIGSVKAIELQAAIEL